MLGLRTRRRIWITLTLLAITSAAIANSWIQARLGRADLFSGYLLLAASGGLWLLSIRKRLLVLRLGSVAFWQQMHQYLGLFALAMFAMHAGFPIRGKLELILSGVFLLISGSGLLGWYLNRTTPKKLLSAGHDVILDDIPGRRAKLNERAYALAITAAGKMESATLAEHYSHFLSPFFQRPRSFGFVIAPNGKLRRSLLHGLDQLDRYLGKSGREARLEMSQLIQSKDDLDYQQALQQRLRLWVVCHVSLVWVFLVLMVMHVILVHRFQGF